ncbi:3-dehydroquinate synthase [Silvanigrella paludirubra]|uniref:3-dehydroquinate synthase n=1 Tax=Silvanigrella paludirubra TaxID=2499159 RepID=A0A6N6VQI0_9BACT|nr:3-dehydroquinate synthase [Silvanigrella paludirubra]KAB8037660.1 3-dehydroquinate synthase [Silvanigrella paludirubra]
MKNFGQSELNMYLNNELFPGKTIQFSTELEKPTPYYFGYKIEDTIIKELENIEFDKLFFLTENSIFKIYGESLYNKIKEIFPNTYLNILQSGEQNKYFKNLEELCEQLIEQNISKKSILIAFGGGGVGNLVGLTAGLIYRGVRFIEIPTTFTGQTDSTLSNKQAVNGKKGKNHFGLYHAPIFIFGDTHYLHTEPKNARRAGIIEGIKNGFISNKNFFEYLYENLPYDNPENSYKTNELALKIIQSKLDILREDPSEKHYGIILEYGHTFGHGIEWLMKGKILHGDAVSFGMRIAAELSKEIGLLSHEEVKLHYDIIENKLGYKEPFPHEITSDILIDAMINDNKKTGRELRFVLLEKIGKCYNPEGDYLVTVELNIVKKVLDNYIIRNKTI